MLVTDGGVKPPEPTEPAEPGAAYVPFLQRTEPPVHVLDIGGGSQWLEDVATRTGGSYSTVPTLVDLTQWVPEVDAPTGPGAGEDPTRDSDGDGVADWIEVHGVTDGVTNGNAADLTHQAGQRRYTSDPSEADTDGDGMLDGDELGRAFTPAEMGGWTSALPIQVYEVVSDPSQDDSDYDGLTDTYEKENGTYPRRADSDRDGLTDYEETQEHGTHPLSKDTDTDGPEDFIEVANMHLGQDPQVYNSQITTAEYAGDFARGALCGEKTGVWAFCDGTTIPYLAGSIASGFLAFGDVRDAIASVWDGHYVIAGLSLAALVPVIGDSASVVIKCTRFLQKLMGAPAAGRAQAAPSGALAMTMATATSAAAPSKHLPDVQAWVANLKIDDAARRKILEQLSPAAVSKLKSVGATDQWIAQIARRGTNLRHLSEVLDAATFVRKAPQPGQFAREKEAEDLLRNATPGAEEAQRRFITPAGKQRYPDVFDPDSGTAFEVKHGTASGRVGARAPRQLQDDLDMAVHPDSEVLEVEWHFFASSNGRIGPDADLLAAMKAADPAVFSFVVWVP